MSPGRRQQKWGRSKLRILFRRLRRRGNSVAFRTGEGAHHSSLVKGPRRYLQTPAAPPLSNRSSSPPPLTIHPWRCFRRVPKGNGR